MIRKKLTYFCIMSGVALAIGNSEIKRDDSRIIERESQLPVLQEELAPLYPTIKNMFVAVSIIRTPVLFMVNIYSIQEFHDEVHLFCTAFINQNREAITKTGKIKSGIGLAPLFNRPRLICTPEELLLQFTVIDSATKTEKEPLSFKFTENPLKDLLDLSSVDEEDQKKAEERFIKFWIDSVLIPGVEGKLKILSDSTIELSW